MSLQLLSKSFGSAYAGFPVQVRDTRGRRPRALVRVTIRALTR